MMVSRPIRVLWWLLRKLSWPFQFLKARNVSPAGFDCPVCGYRTRPSTDRDGFFGEGLEERYYFVSGKCACCKVGLRFSGPNPYPRSSRSSSIVVV